MCTITCAAQSICSTQAILTSAPILFTLAKKKLLNNADLKDKNEEAHQRVVEDAKNYGQMIKANMKGGMGYYPPGGIPPNLGGGNANMQHREGDFFIPQPNNFTTNSGRNEEQDDVFYN